MPIGNFRLKWYEYLSVIGLILSKTMLQLIYIHGKAYDDQQEKELLIQVAIKDDWNSEWGMLLRSQIGNELSRIVFQFLYECKDKLKKNDGCDWSVLICCRT